MTRYPEARSCTCKRRLSKTASTKFNGKVVMR